jgi:hypothetical protein
MSNDDLEVAAATKILDNPDQKIGYSDIAYIRVSAEEVVLHFGLRTEDALDDNIGNGVAKVYVSLPHARRIANSLTKSLAAYEEAFGKIESDPEKRLSTKVRARLERAAQSSKKVGGIRE